jgi:lipopolysaccharide/colanic/teichoic acid biosynthesis glycosyltransferase
MDRLVAFFLLVCLAPFVLILLIITFIDLRCNPIFVQKRTISGITEFNFYKIRSMRKDAPEVPTGELLSPQKHITYWGKFLRSNSLDELLNLICIIKGDMKFLGPRPIMPCEHKLIHFRLYHNIQSKPGITGLAQINGRDLISINRKVACEKIYEKRKHSMVLRLYILLKTLEIVIKKSGISH